MRDRPTDERPLRPTTFEQPPERIGGGRRGGSRLVVVLAGALAVAAVGLAGRLSGAADPPGRSATAVESTRPARAATPAPGAALVLTEPSRSTVNTVAVRVRGRAADAVREIDLVVLRGDAELATQTVRPTRSGLFAGVFTLGAPRSEGPATVVATARDADGTPVATVRVEFALGALTASTTGAAAIAAGAGAAEEPRPPRLGEDGVLGSRGVDLSVYRTGDGTPGQWPVGRLGWQVNPAQL